MHELSLKLNESHWYDIEIKDYLLTQKEVQEVDINNNKIYIKYTNKNYLKILIKEIKLFLSILNEPAILYFNKHSNNKLSEHTICIKDLCCEYCLMGTIEDLLCKEGIISAYTDFDFINKENVNINITYDDSIITKKEILDLEEKLNS